MILTRLYCLRPSRCGAAACRLLVSGQDYLASWIDEVYGEHVSDYVATKRRQAAAAQHGDVATKHGDVAAKQGTA